MVLKMKNAFSQLEKRIFRCRPTGGARRGVRLGGVSPPPGGGVHLFRRVTCTGIYGISGLVWSYTVIFCACEPSKGCV